MRFTNEKRSPRAGAVKRLNAALVGELVRRRLSGGPELGRADLIAQRIVALGGEPDYSSLRLALRARAAARA